MRKKSFDSKIFKSSLLRGLFLLLPYLLIAISVFCITTVGLDAFTRSSIVFTTVKNEVKEQNEESNDRFEMVDVIDEKFPYLKYQKVWSLINVEGWKQKDIPCYYGDNNSLLMKGAGKWDGSDFCGQNGCTIISAHVTMHFKELQDTKVGTVVTMDTVYGTYKYEVTEVRIFNPGQADEFFYNDYEEETLIMYTCYPRESRNRKQRIALICTKLEGKVFKDYAK